MAGAEVSTERLQCCAVLTAQETAQHHWVIATLTSSGVSFHLYWENMPYLSQGEEEIHSCTRSMNVM